VAGRLRSAQQMCRSNKIAASGALDPYGNQFSLPDLNMMLEEVGDVYERFSRYVNRNQI
jgi:hypothetical protein